MKHISLKIDNNIGFIKLNRPKSLNALSLEILQTLTDTLAQWKDDPTIKAICIEGEGERAFCAGGDVRAIYEHPSVSAAEQNPFFTLEYGLNETIFNYPKPYIAILNGITMGGGVGVSVWGSHCIATDRLVFAMPETAIGLFPDIGASYFLTRLPHHIGFYLGLTGNSINAYESLKLGLVKTVIDSKTIDSFKQSLNPNDIQLPQPITLNTNSELFAHQEDINICFSLDTVPEIIAALETKDAWCQSIAATLKTRSPLSMVVTLEYLKRSQGKSFHDIMQINRVLVENFIKNGDFLEGIRAAIIDKDKNPKWRYQLDEIDQIDIDAFFNNMLNV